MTTGQTTPSFPFTQSEERPQGAFSAFSSVREAFPNVIMVHVGTSARRRQQQAKGAAAEEGEERRALEWENISSSFSAPFIT